MEDEDLLQLQSSVISSLRAEQPEASTDAQVFDTDIDDSEAFRNAALKSLSHKSKKSSREERPWYIDSKGHRVFYAKNSRHGARKSDGKNRKQNSADASIFSVAPGGTAQSELKPSKLLAKIEEFRRSEAERKRSSSTSDKKRSRDQRRGRRSDGNRRRPHRSRSRRSPHGSRSDHRDSPKKDERSRRTETKPSAKWSRYDGNQSSADSNGDSNSDSDDDVICSSKMTSSDVNTINDSVDSTERNTTRQGISPSCSGSCGASTSDDQRSIDSPLDKQDIARHDGKDSVITEVLEDPEVHQAEVGSSSANQAFSSGVVSRTMQGMETVPEVKTESYVTENLLDDYDIELYDEGEEQQQSVIESDCDETKLEPIETENPAATSATMEGSSCGGPLSASISISDEHVPSVVDDGKVDLMLDIRAGDDLKARALRKERKLERKLAKIRAILEATEEASVVAPVLVPVEITEIPRPSRLDVSGGVARRRRSKSPPSAGRSGRSKRQDVAASQRDRSGPVGGAKPISRHVEPTESAKRRKDPPVEPVKRNRSRSVSRSPTNQHKTTPPRSERRPEKEIVDHTRMRRKSKSVERLPKVEVPLEEVRVISGCDSLKHSPVLQKNRDPTVRSSLYRAHAPHGHISPIKKSKEVIDSPGRLVFQKAPASKASPLRRDATKRGTDSQLPGNFTLLQSLAQYLDNYKDIHVSPKEAIGSLKRSPVHRSPRHLSPPRPTAHLKKPPLAVPFRRDVAKRGTDSLLGGNGNLQTDVQYLDDHNSSHVSPMKLEPANGSPKRLPVHDHNSSHVSPKKLKLANGSPKRLPVHQSPRHGSPPPRTDDLKKLSVRSPLRRDAGHRGTRKDGAHVSSTRSTRAGKPTPGSPLRHDVNRHHHGGVLRNGGHSQGDAKDHHHKFPVGSPKKPLRDHSRPSGSSRDLPSTELNRRNSSRDRRKELDYYVPSAKQPNSGSIMQRSKHESKVHHSSDINSKSNRSVSPATPHQPSSIESHRHHARSDEHQRATGVEHEREHIHSKSGDHIHREKVQAKPGRYPVQDTGSDRVHGKEQRHAADTKLVDEEKPKPHKSSSTKSSSSEKKRNSSSRERVSTPDRSRQNHGNIKLKQESNDFVRGGDLHSHKIRSHEKVQPATDSGHVRSKERSGEHSSPIKTKQREDASLSITATGESPSKRQKMSEPVIFSPSERSDGRSDRHHDQSRDGSNRVRSEKQRIARQDDRGNGRRTESESSHLNVKEKEKIHVTSATNKNEPERKRDIRAVSPSPTVPKISHKHRDAPPQREGDPDLKNIVITKRRHDDFESKSPVKPASSNDRTVVIDEEIPLLKSKLASKEPNVPERIIALIDGGSEKVVPSSSMIDDGKSATTSNDEIQVELSSAKAKPKRKPIQAPDGAPEDNVPGRRLFLMMKRQETTQQSNGGAVLESFGVKLDIRQRLGPIPSGGSDDKGGVRNVVATNDTLPFFNIPKNMTEAVAVSDANIPVKSAVFVQNFNRPKFRKDSARKYRKHRNHRN